MNGKYLCWGDGYGEEDAREVNGLTPHAAALNYAEERDAGATDIDPERVIFVRDGATVRAFEVTRYMVAEYEARERKG